MDQTAVTATSADVIAEALYRAGVRDAFGIPGGEVLAIIDALGRAGIRVHVAKHENAAGFMAEGTHHATGAPAVLVATVGPGIANAVNVVANADQDRVPMVVISGRVAEADALTYSHQVFDHQAVLRPICKASFEARAGAAGPMIDKAIRIALDPRPGPVHIDLPIPIASAPDAGPRPRRAPAAPSAPAGAALEAARAKLATADRPVIVAGLDLLASPGAPELLAAEARRHGIPVLTTYKAKGVLPEDDPLSLGGHGLSPKSDAIVLPLLRAADCVIAAGYDPIEMRAGWRDPWDPAVASEIAPVPDTQYLHQASELFACDPAEGLDALFADQPSRPRWIDGAPAQVRAALTAAFAPRDAWGPDRALHRLNARTPEHVVTTVDSGAHRILLSQIWTCRAPGRLLQSTGLCTMGCALPLATGRALAEPGRRTLAVMGDGCLDMVLGELTTLRDQRLPVTVVVLVDGSYALIDLKQRRDGLQESAVGFGRTDYAAIAEAMGLPAARAADEESLEAALDRAFGDAPLVISVEIPGRAYDGLI